MAVEGFGIWGGGGLRGGVGADVDVEAAGGGEDEGGGWFGGGAGDLGVRILILVPGVGRVGVRYRPVVFAAGDGGEGGHGCGFWGRCWSWVEPLGGEGAILGGSITLCVHNRQRSECIVTS